MAAAVPSLIVNELLDKNNYEDWRVRVRTYLKAKGLWSVIVEASDVPPKRKDKREAWNKGNAETLHAIHLCCGNEAFKVIRGEKLPYKAWLALRHFGGVSADTESERYLKSESESESESEPEPEPEETKVVVEDDVTEKDSEEEEIQKMEDDLQTIDHDAQPEGVVEAGDKADKVDIPDEGDEDDSIPGLVCEELFRNAKHSKWNSVMEILKKHPYAVSEAAPNDDDKTVLHYAVEDMRADIVKQLMPLIKDEDDLDLWDSECNTALEYCYMLPDEDEMVEIAKCLVERKNELRAGGSDIDYPALLLESFTRGRPKLTDYLFNSTQFKNEDQYAPQFISLSFSTKKFDIACKLINQRPELGIAEDFSGNSPLNELACTPSAFLSGSRLKFWEKWIYHVISIEPSIKGPEAKYGKGKPTATLHAVSGEVQPEKDERLTDAADTIVEFPAFDVYKDKKDGHSRLGFFRNFCWCLNVSALFQGSIIHHPYNKILGISHIYEMKESHFRVHEIFVCMCKVLTKEKMEENGTKKIEFVEAALFQATERGLVEFLIEIFKVNPHLSKTVNKKGQSLFQVAVEYRQAEVFNLIHGFNKDNIKNFMSMTDDDDENNMLHMMGISPPSSLTNRIRGAALQMQNELQWFKELELMASPEDLEAENDILDMTPREFFSKNHTEMVKAGEKSMKDTATSCTVVGALMVTMMFAVAFTLPTQLKGDSTPLLDRRAFRVFIIADAISLFSSTTSVVLFLGILTSRYAEEDFDRSLPLKMILGLLTLFLSVAAMVVVFASALFIILPSDTWIALPTTLVAGIPILTFVWMQFPFLVEIFYSTYIRRVFDKKVLVKLNVGKVR